MVIQIISVLVGCFIITLCGAALGYRYEHRRKNSIADEEIKRLRDTISYLESYINFIEIELVSERRSKINVTIKEDNDNEN